MNGRNRTLLLSTSLIALVSSLLFGGCQLIQTKQGGEPPAGADATPPAGYSPIYVKRVGKFSTAAEDAAIQVTRVEINDPSKVRLIVHVVDSNGVYLSGAAAERWRSWWCDVRDSGSGASYPLADFTLREVTERDRESHAVAFVMDHSGSMGETRARAVQDAVSGLIDKKRDEDAFALIKYDGKVAVEAPLTPTNSLLKWGLRMNGLQGFGGLTAIGNGTAEGVWQVAASTADRRAVTVFTDGLDNSSTIDRDSVIRLARNAGVIVNTVDFGENTDGDYLRTVATETGGSYYKIYRTEEFDVLFEDIYRRLRNYYVIEYAPSWYGQHDVTLRLCLEKDTLMTNVRFDNTPRIGAIALLNVFFDVGKSEIKPESDTAIDNVVRLMGIYPNMQIELRGHTDTTNSTGDPDFNMKLSQSRAEAVRNALIAHGIAADRVRALGFGPTQPIASNDTPEGRARNRRTEFAIVRR